MILAISSVSGASSGGLGSSGRASFSLSLHVAAWLPLCAVWPAPVGLLDCRLDLVDAAIGAPRDHFDQVTQLQGAEFSPQDQADEGCQHVITRRSSAQPLRRRT